MTLLSTFHGPQDEDNFNWWPVEFWSQTTSRVQDDPTFCLCRTWWTSLSGSQRFCPPLRRLIVAAWTAHPEHLRSCRFQREHVRTICNYLNDEHFHDCPRAIMSDIIERSIGWFPSSALGSLCESSLLKTSATCKRPLRAEHKDRAAESLVHFLRSRFMFGSQKTCFQSCGCNAPFQRNKDHGPRSHKIAFFLLYKSSKDVYTQFCSLFSTFPDLFLTVYPFVGA